MKQSTSKKLILIIVIVILLAGGGYVYSLTGNHINPPEDLDAFAQCLTDKGLVLYGTYRCGYCNQQKAMFGG